MSFICVVYTKESFWQSLTIKHTDPCFQLIEHACPLLRYDAVQAVAIVPPRHDGPGPGGHTRPLIATVAIGGAGGRLSLWLPSRPLNALTGTRGSACEGGPIAVHELPWGRPVAVTAAVDGVMVASSDGCIYVYNLRDEHFRVSKQKRLF